MAEDLESRIIDAFTDPAPTAGPDGLKRALNRRASGERVELGSRQRISSWMPGLGIGAIAALLLLMFAALQEPEKAPRGNSSVSQLAEVALMPQALLAQGSDRPAYPVMAADGPDLKPGEWAYAGLDGGAEYNDSMPLRQSRLSPGSFNGVPSWLLLGRPAKKATPLQWLDTSWIDRSSLKLLARSTSVMNGEARVTEEFREHDMLKGFTKGGYTTWSVLVTDSTPRDDSNGYALQGDVLFMALRRTRLSSDWHASIELMSFPAYSRVTSRWYDLAVVGEERIRVPAGEFDCWKIRFGPPLEYRRLGQIWIYVSKDRQWIIKQGIQGGTQREFWSVLVSGKED